MRRTNAAIAKAFASTYPMLLAARMPKMFPMKRTKRMLSTMSSDIALPGTLKRLSRPSSLTVRPSLEIPKSARLPSAVAVFIEIMKLMHMTATKKFVRSLPTSWLRAPT